ncbi:transcriptional regulator, HxlR family [Salimicrobium album]|uniref:Transcriptional regulator, HxlR family n=2 Tax=Salimicrobium album TaxID=50717 RepID=A0A1H3BCT9_9BACI|nr:transcriptional regulator, HxlR family [Salimicrobium album]
MNEKYVLSSKIVSLMILMEGTAMNEHIKPDQCQVQEAIGILVGKWKPIILLHLMKEGTQRFSELKREIPEITQKMLTKQLRELEAEGIVDRKVYPEIPPKVEYSITEYGKELQPILEAMHEWGEKHAQMKKERA